MTTKTIRVRIVEIAKHAAAGAAEYAALAGVPEEQFGAAVAAAVMMLTAGNRAKTNHARRMAQDLAMGHAPTLESDELAVAVCMARDMVAEGKFDGLDIQACMKIVVGRMDK